MWQDPFRFDTALYQAFLSLKIGSQFVMSYVKSVKVGLSLSKKKCVICFIESPLKMMKNAFYFILKALSVLKIFKFLSRLFGLVRKTA